MWPPRAGKGPGSKDTAVNSGFEHSPQALALRPPLTPLHVSRHPLLLCANVTFLLVQSHVFFLVGVPRPHWLAAPHAQALSKALLFALPTALRPHRHAAPCHQPTAPGRAHGGRADRNAPRWLPAAGRAHGPRTAQPGRAGGTPTAPRDSLEDDRCPLEDSEGSSQRRGLLWGGRRPRGLSRPHDHADCPLGPGTRATAPA